MRGTCAVVVRLAVAAFVVAGYAADARAQIHSKVYATGFSKPVAIVQDPTDPSVQFVVEKDGRIRPLQNGVVLPDFLDLSGSVNAEGERGVFSLAFAPDYATSGRFFVNFIDPNGNTVIARFVRSGNPLVADPASRFDLHWGGPEGLPYIIQPYGDHNGGDLAFGPDGYLYIGLGDGGGDNDPDHRAQNPATLLGKMLRIDVNVPDDDPTGYAIPTHNPFLESDLPGVLPEIWAFGLRNPWRYSFDDVSRGGTGALVIADVGQSLWEEVDYEPPVRGGRNYGWRNREGAHDNTNVEPLPPAFEPLVNPIHEYSRGDGIAITGGFVYRGTALGPAYQGRYFFGDFGSAHIWSLGLTIDPDTGEAQVADLIDHSVELGGGTRIKLISSFGVDAGGELFIVSYSLGTIFAIVPPQAPVVSRDPTNAVRQPGVRAVFRAESSTVPTPSVQWQMSADGGATWTDIPGETATTYSLVADLSINGEQFRAVFSNAAGQVATASASLTVRRTAPADADGDAESDLVIWRPGGGTWFTLTSGSGYDYAESGAEDWGSAIDGDVPLVGDIDGDGRIDRIVWRASTGTWYWLTSSTGFSYAMAGSKPWGETGDTPLVADLDGDGKSDLVVWHPPTGTWSWLLSTTGYDETAAGSKDWGASSEGDRPFLADVDGDGLADLIVWRASTGVWYWLTSGSGYAYISAGCVAWGLASAGDIPLIGDFDGDSLADFVVWRASTGTWYWLTSSSGYSYLTAGSKPWGVPGDVPVLADLDGDGVSDLTIWRPSNGTWYWLTAASGYAYASGHSKAWGYGPLGDIPVIR